MNPEERQLLKETAELVRENHKILKSMRRSARFASFLRFIYWAVILGGVVASYYYIKPYIDPIINGYQSIQENIQTVKDTAGNLPSLPSWLGGKQ